MFTKFFSFSLVGLLLISASVAAKCGYVDVDGAEIFYQLTGKGKKTLVFITGTPGTTELWQCQVKELGKDFKCLTIDYPGFGRSTVPPALIPEEIFTAPYLASVIHAVIASLGSEGVCNPVLITSSVGSFVGITYALTYTTGSAALSGLILVDGTARIAEDPNTPCYIGLPQAIVDELLFLAANDYPEFIAVSLAPLATGSCAPSETLDKLVADLATLFLGANCLYVATALTNFANTDLRSVVSGITIPTLIIYGGQDTTLPIEESFFLRETIPNSILFELCDKTHLPFLTDVHRFNKEVKRFVCNDLCNCDICDLHVTPRPIICPSPVIAN